jgi:putative transcriptional regulator
MINKNPIKVKSLLISEPFMLDPNFTRSVILICELNEEGTLGLILNQRSNLLLKDVIEDVSDADFPVYIGGPVGLDSLQFVHKCYDRLNSGIPLGDGLYWGGNFEALKLLILQNKIKNNEIKFFIGYSGWSGKQIEDELEENAWIISNKFNPDIIFVHDEENLWKEVIVNLGPKYAHVAQFPINPSWN